MDARQRQLERAASAGDVEAAARLLRERVRHGDLPEARLVLAAHLGDAAARAALGDAAPGPAPALDAWIHELGAWGHEAVARAAVAAAAVAVDALAPAAGDVAGRATAMLGLARAWLAGGLAHAPPPPLGGEDAVAAGTPQGVALFALLVALDRVLHPSGAPRRTGARGHTGRTAHATRAAARVLGLAVEALGAEGEARVRAGLAAELVPWALRRGQAPV